MALLFDMFSPQTKADWLQKVEKDLKGKPMASLNWEWSPSISGSPFYHREDIAKSPAPLLDHRTSNDWEMGVFILVKDATDANKQALTLLKRGAEALYFRFEKDLSSSELQILFSNIQLEAISLHIEMPPTIPSSFYHILHHTIQTHSSDSFQPNYYFIKTDLGWTLEETDNPSPETTYLSVDARSLYKGKEDPIEELANCLHMGNRILHQLNQEGYSIKDWQNQIYFSLILDDIYFLNIAKIRALKLVWRQVIQAWGGNPELSPSIEVHLTQAAQSQQADYNKIKATAQAISAVVGGANRLFIHPSDAFENESGTPFSQRIALNIQHLLKQESYLNRVIDPSAGSYFIEELTESLAQKTWTHFQQLEATQK